MKNLFKYAAVHWKSLLAIIVILFVQAYCDLSLPAYTSDIVNVGPICKINGIFLNCGIDVGGSIFISPSCKEEYILGNIVNSSFSI